jgi:BirA family biotin operon repressor/biotin-[acetyl-CoA-carboxylase] ligase
MKWIKLDATPSTNAYLKNLLEEVPFFEEVAVTTKRQTQGRGQRGATWQSEGGKNLTMSYLHLPNSLEVSRQFELNMGVALGVLDVLEAHGLPELSVKWPNDILSSAYKIGGILIENQLKGRFLNSAIVGLGLNVHQEEFTDLPQARSLIHCAPGPYHLEKMSKAFVEAWKRRLEPLSLRPHSPLLKEEYESRLFGKDQWNDFREPKSEVFQAQVRGVEESGKLRLELKSGEQRLYDLKEVEMIYSS